MSTHLFLTCKDHSPPLRAEDESGQHLYDLPTIRMDIRDRVEMVRFYRDGGDFSWFQKHTARFLAQHEGCRIGIVDEYGQEHATQGTSNCGGRHGHGPHLWSDGAWQCPGYEEEGEGEQP